MKEFRAINLINNRFIFFFLMLAIFFPTWSAYGETVEERLQSAPLAEKNSYNEAILIWLAMAKVSGLENADIDPEILINLRKNGVDSLDSYEKNIISGAICSYFANNAYIIFEGRLLGAFRISSYIETIPTSNKFNYEELRRIAFDVFNRPIKANSRPEDAADFEMLQCMRRGESILQK